ncbi:unnamed protein product [Bursaphelenchus xylophilus]|uniref:(pine wood nematode) hypothetical protein n=1 Tax=Bursaphelenchus xylophilus TaxID=6326 RepID=A0A1I7RQ77_BURXY|nr:unnamed protein product [Bursaphelenchus xylophilus]CAG9097276.1 unnamed protein product [Bursaphelenchus xylophilus]
MVKVVITGGSGFVAAHLIRRLQERCGDIVDEIHTIDRRPLTHSVNGGIPLTHHGLDLNDERSADVFDGAKIVFHLARKQYDPIMGTNKAETYDKDNFEATKNVVDSVIQHKVQGLVYLGDAFANVPSRDNFGNSEDVHAGEPSSYLLGSYGESKTKAELYVRNKIGTEYGENQKLYGVCFRPTVIYGEGSRGLINAVKRVAEANNGELVNISGSSNGMLQYIYAGNLAIYLEEAMRVLLKEPAEISGHFFYCMDKTEATQFNKVMAKFLEPYGISLKSSFSFLSIYLQTAYAQTKLNLFGIQPEKPVYNMGALRLFVIYAIGFSNRKQQLMFKSRPQFTQEEAMERTARWIASKNFNQPELPLTQEKPIFRRG